MKQYTVYVCETCGYESTDVEDMKTHEALHGRRSSEICKDRTIRFYKRSERRKKNKDSVEVRYEKL